MRKIIFFGLLLAVTIVACEKDDYVPSYVSIGSIETVDDLNTDFIVNLDNGDVISPTNIYTDNTVEDGDRVIVEYAIIEEKSSDAFDVKIFDIDDILTKGVIQLTVENQDSIANDPIQTTEDDMWLSEKHLNILFNYYGNSQTHYINLVKPIGDVTHDDEGRLILEFRHNSNGDYHDRLMAGIVSFELESLRIADEESVDFIVKVKGYYDEEFEFEGSYNFESSSKSVGVAKQNIKLLNVSNLRSNNSFR